MVADQITMQDTTVSGSYWVVIVSHPIIATGTRYLVISKWGAGDWLVCWRDGVKPEHNGTLLLPEHVRKVEP